MRPSAVETRHGREREKMEGEGRENENVICATVSGERDEAHYHIYMDLGSGERRREEVRCTPVSFLLPFVRGAHSITAQARRCLSEQLSLTHSLNGSRTVLQPLAGATPVFEPTP